MISPNRIRFGGVFSNELNMPDLIMDCAFDSDNSEVSTFLTRKAVASESYDGRNRRINSFKYTENFAPKFTFLKKDFEDFTQEEVRSILKYLTSKDTTGLLEAYDDDSNVISWASIGNFSEIQLYKIANKRVVGVTAVWDSCMPFALSDLYTVTKTISSTVNTTMYRWTPTSNSGTTMPTYVLSSNRTLAVGDKLYTFTGDNIDTIQKENMSSYGTISAASNGIYTVNQLDFTMSSATAVIVQNMNNKIIIEIDTDDNKPVYPRIQIQHNGSVVRIPDGTTLNNLSNMVENTAYFNGTTYYWKSSERVSSATKPNYNWEMVTVETDYSDNDVIDKDKIYYYKKSETYYWIEPYYFHESTTNPNLATTSVRFTNTHTDFLNQSTVLDSTIVKNNNTTEIITLDGANRIISSNIVNRIFDDDFVDWRWLPLLDGKNEITVEGNCTATFWWREVRKVGEY